MIIVNLYGNLRSAQDSRFALDVASPAEAVRALCFQIAGLREKIANGVFQVRFDGRDLSEDEVKTSFAQQGSGVLHIVPRTAGAGKNGWTNVVMGMALIVASVATSGWATTAALGAKTSAAVGAATSAMATMGISLTLNGVSMLLAKQKAGSNNQTESKSSTGFSNLANTSAQGAPVPLVYGLVMCGTRVISQSVESYRTGTKAAISVEEASKPLSIVKVYHTPVAALDPNGRAYNIDLNNESVKEANYTAQLVREGTNAPNTKQNAAGQTVKAN